MIPQLGAQPTVGSPLQSASETAAERAARTDTPTRAGRPSGAETARAVDPPAPAGSVSPLDKTERRNLNPPDPNAPAGPPPAFEASILDRQREAALRPPEPELRLVEAAPPDTGIAQVAAVDAPDTVSSDPRQQVPTRAVDAEDAAGETARTEPGARGEIEEIDTAPIRAPEVRAEPVAEPEPAREPETARGDYDVPPSAEQRAEREVATIRRIETPYDTATVDVSR